MNELTKVILDNEMDLILAHKQSMRLGELAGLSLGGQTTFATAVSEVCRSAIGRQNVANLTLYVSDKKENPKYITAVLRDQRKDFSHASDDGYNYAKRLVQNISVTNIKGTNNIELNYRIPTNLRIDDILLEKWRIMLNTDPDISPYEEIKRKNNQLIELADKLRESEQQYKALTDSLPVMIFSTTTGGAITYANQWLYDYTGETVEKINATGWQNILHPDDFSKAGADWQNAYIKPGAVITPEIRLRHAETGEYRWHTGVSISMKGDDGTVTSRNTFMVDIQAQKLIEAALKDNQQLKKIHTELEDKVSQLNKSNQQLEQFAYITSHDLQEPLRKISFYSDLIIKKYGHTIPAEAGFFFDTLVSATERMKLLIQDILAYSLVQKEGFIPVPLNDVIEDILQDLEISIREKGAKINVGELPVIEGNTRQLKQLFENLVSNSLKFSLPGKTPTIDISATTDGDMVSLSFKDNGIGFDDIYIGKMFDLFQQLHARDKYTGTGIGLAICKKIVDMHNGSITAAGSLENGATFLVVLPVRQAPR